MMRSPLLFLSAFFSLFLLLIACANRSTASQETDVLVDSTSSQVKSFQKENAEEEKGMVDVVSDEDLFPEESEKQNEYSSAVKEKSVAQTTVKQSAMEQDKVLPAADKTDNPVKLDLVEQRDLSSKEVPEQKVQKQDVALSHQLWDDLLRKYVSASGYVNYAGMRKEKSKLEEYLTLLAGNPPAENWTPQQEMAFWINAYNAYTVALILENYPLKSIRELHGGNPWDVKWITIGRHTYSLNEIENEMLRKQFKDARIHFAVNCAAKSCPPLYNRAFTAASLSRTLDARARAFINDTQYNQIGAEEVRLSKIFDWYAADFGDLIAFISRYADSAPAADARVVFLEYDWALNGH